MAVALDRREAAGLDRISTPLAEARRGHETGPLRRAFLPGPYVFTPLRVIDGDTFEGRLRIWFGQEITTLVRLRNIDAPELKSRCESEAKLATEARGTLEEILQSGTVFLRDISLDKYAGRVVADVGIRVGGYQSDDVGELMRAGGYARPYGGGRRASWCG